MKKLCAIMVIMGVMVLGISGHAMANLITNGNFDSGLAGWTTSGDVNLGTSGASPLIGNYALLGYDESSGTSSIAQSFAIADGINQLAVSFSYSFTGSDTAPYRSDEALAALRQSFWFFSSEYELLTATSPDNFGSGTYYGVVNVANWFGIDATTGNLIFSLNESSPLIGLTNSAFAIDNVSVAAVPEPTTMLLLGLGLVGLSGMRRRK